MKCPECGANDLTGLYCQNCGAKLVDDSEPNQELPSLEKNILVLPQKRKLPLNIILFAILGSLVVFAVVMTNSNKNVSNTNIVEQQPSDTTESQNETTYQECIKLMQSMSWTDASVKLINLKDINYKNAKTLYNYCKARLSFNTEDFHMAKFYVNNISDDYNGEFYNQVITFKKEIEQQKYKIAFELIKNSKLQNAIAYSVNDDDLKPFYNLANAIDLTEKGDFNMARSYAEDFKDYNGYASDEVKSYVNTILNETTPEKLKARKKSEGVRISMTEQEVLDSSWGKPDHINKTSTSFGVHEQWVYGNSYLYFEDGILTTIQN